MKNRDEKLLAEAYQKIVETNLEIRNQYGDIESRDPRYTTPPTKEEEQERERQSSAQEYERARQRDLIEIFKDPAKFLQRFNSILGNKRDLNLTAQDTPEKIKAAAEQLAKKYITRENDRMYLGLDRLGREVSAILKQQAQTKSSQPQQTASQVKYKPFKPQSRFQKFMGKLGVGK